jgi:hypothetical protein
LKLSLRSRIPFLVGLLLTIAFLALSPAIGRHWRRGASDGMVCKLTAESDLSGLYRLRSAAEMERNANLDAAETEFRDSLKSPNACIRATASAELERTEHFRQRLGPFYEVVSAASLVSFHLRAPILAILFLFGFTWLVAALIPRRGTRVSEFPVFGSVDPSSNKLFRDALVRFANDIGRFYGSSYASSLGITLIFDDLEGVGLEDDEDYKEILAVARDPDAKAVFGLGLSRLVRFVREAANPPQLLVKGDVRVFPGGALAVGYVKDFSSGKEARIEARTSELGEIPTPGPSLIHAAVLGPSFTSPHASGLTFKKSEDLRQISSQLYLLALLFACKLRYEQTRTQAAGYKPGSWQTVCLFSAIASSLE